MTPTDVPTLDRRRRQGDTRLLIIFAIVIFAFVLASIRTEAQARSIEATNARISHQAYVDCLTRNESARDLNRVLDSIISAVKETPGLSSTERNRRISIYQGAKQGVVDCGARR